MRLRRSFFLLRWMSIIYYKHTEWDSPIPEKCKEKTPGAAGGLLSNHPPFLTCPRLFAYLNTIDIRSPFTFVDDIPVGIEPCHMPGECTLDDILNPVIRLLLGDIEVV
jgi:hypothetical protein